MAAFTYRLSTPDTAIPFGTAFISRLTLGHSGTVSNVSLSLIGLSHDWIADLDVMLRYDTSTTDTRLLQVLSDVSTASGTINSTLIFDDSASDVLTVDPLAPLVDSGAYRPFATPGETLFDYDPLEPAIPAASATGDGTVSFASAFNGLGASGTWSLYVRDDLAGISGFLQGWSLSLQTTGTGGVIRPVAGNAPTVIAFASGSGASGSYSQTGGIEVTYSGVTDWSITTGDGEDVLIGPSVDTTFISVRGNDFLQAGSGNDDLNAGGGRDTVYGGDGDDEFVIQKGLQFDDLVAGEIYNGGNGADVLTLIANDQSTTFDLRTVTLAGFETLSLVSTGLTISQSILLNDTQIGPGLAANATINLLLQPSEKTLTIFMGLQSSLNLSGLTILVTPAQLARFEVFGDGSSETLTGTSIADLIDGGSGNDLVSGGAGNDSLFGAIGNDLLYGGNGNDVLEGGTGNDNLWGGLGADQHAADTGAGVDYARYDDADHGSLMIRLDNAALNSGAAAVGDTYSGIEGLVGGAGNDSVYGDGDGNFLFGSGGADQVFGNAGNDYLDGGNGGDNLWGGEGADQHIGGDGPGVDYARYDDADHGNLTIRLDAPAANTGAAAAGDTYTGIEGLVGGAGNDTVYGDGFENFLFGSGGNDLVYGNAGNDYLDGGTGSDNLWGGAGADAHFGGSDAGIDYARYDDANHGNLTIRLDAPAANAGAAAVGDIYTGIEGLVGGAGNDVVIGNASANWLFGSAGNDFIDGLGGNDYLNGGLGADRFRLSTAIGAGNIDTIADFQAGVDDILLVQAIFAAIGPALTADEFRIGAAADANDYLLYNSATGALTYDSNGNAAGGATQIATLSTGLALTVADFVMV